MRWLLVKDLQILKRSPLVPSLLVISPIVIAVLVGFALSRGPDKPRVAFLNEVPAGQSLSLGDTQLDQNAAKDELCGRIDCIAVDSREEAEEKVRSGEVLAALILPKDLVEKLRSTITTNNFEQPVGEVIVNEEDPVKRQLVDDRITSLVNEANLKVSNQFSDVLTTSLQLLIKGGDFGFLGQTVKILGLEQTQALLENVARKLRSTITTNNFEQPVV